MACWYLSHMGLVSCKGSIWAENTFYTKNGTLEREDGKEICFSISVYLSASAVASHSQVSRKNLEPLESIHSPSLILSSFLISC